MGRSTNMFFNEFQGFLPRDRIDRTRAMFCLRVFRFLYSDEVQIGPETVMTTLYTAKKYAVPALEAHCVEFLKKNLRADNAFMLLTQVSLQAFVLSPLTRSIAITDWEFSECDRVDCPKGSSSASPRILTGAQR